MADLGEYTSSKSGLTFQIRLEKTLDKSEGQDWVFAFSVRSSKTGHVRQVSALFKKAVYDTPGKAELAAENEAFRCLCRYLEDIEEGPGTYLTGDLIFASKDDSWRLVG